MKALTAKSRRALLIFLSTLTLTLVFYVSLPARPFLHRTNHQVEIQIEKRKTAHQKIIQDSQVASSHKVQTREQISVAYAPWTEAASPRAPPA